MNNYKVYIHIFPNNKVYIGVTGQKDVKTRWNSGYGYKNNQYMTNAIMKYGWDNVIHKILYTNLKKEEAEEIEIKLIKEYKADNKRYGYNIEYGGCHNGKTSEITRKRISEANKGKHNSPKTEFKKGHITIITEEIKQKISEKTKGNTHQLELNLKKDINLLM